MKPLSPDRDQPCPRYISQLNPKIQREGVVLRPLAEEYDEDIGGRLSFKVINPRFLLKYDE